MLSMENHMDRFMAHEEARRHLYLRPTMSMPQSTISGLRDEALTVRRNPLDLGPSHQHQLQQRIRCQTFTKRNDPIVGGPTSAVSRRNARERKRVRLVNLGFSTLRERVPPGTKNKKLSKVETLRAAIEYIRQLQQVLGISDQDCSSMMLDEDFGCPEDSSIASSDEVTTGFHGGCGPATGSGTDLSPASSHPSDCSLVSSPYPPQHSHDDQLLDIGVWFS